jgi:methylamine dehydrogenase accessory protein MauD
VIALYVSTVLLWLAVGVLALLVLALARQVGVLHERVAPLGALMLDQGPKVGERAPIFEIKDLLGRPTRLGGLRGRPLLLLFVSSTCPVCKKILPIALRLAREENLDLALIGDEREEDLRRLAQGLAEVQVLNAPEVGQAYKVGKIPYAVLIDPEGVIRAKGLVNNREHLESLMEAYRLGMASIQDYLNYLRKEG